MLCYEIKTLVQLFPSFIYTHNISCFYVLNDIFMHYNFTLTEIPQNNSKIICPELLVKFNEIFNLKKTKASFGSYSFNRFCNRF